MQFRASAWHVRFTEQLLVFCASPSPKTAWPRESCVRSEVPHGGWTAGLPPGTCPSRSLGGGKGSCQQSIPVGEQGVGTSGSYREAETSASQAAGAAGQVTLGFGHLSGPQGANLQFYIS